MKKKGFTLIELVVVMAIIAVLAMLIVGAIVVARNTARETANRTNAKAIQAGLEAFYSRHRRYPNVITEIEPPAIAAGTTASFKSVAEMLGVELDKKSACDINLDRVGGGGLVRIEPGTFDNKIKVLSADCTEQVDDEDWMEIILLKQ